MNIYYEKGRMIKNMTDEYNRLIAKRVKTFSYTPLTQPTIA